MRLRAAALASLPLLAAAASCSDAPPAPAAIALSMRSPAGLLDGATDVTLWVAPAGDTFTCDETSGATSGDPSAQGGHSFVLSNQSCPNGGKWCGDISLSLDPATELVFAVQAKKGVDLLGVGCTTAAVASDPFSVAITIRKYVPPSVCGNGKIEVGEECDEGDDENCTADCKAKEVLLSADFALGSDPVVNEPKGSKLHVATMWQQDPGNVNPNPFRAVWEDTASASSVEIDFRQMTATLGSVSSPAALAGAKRLPCTSGPAPLSCPRALAQKNPAIAPLADGTFVVAFEDSRKTGGGSNVVLTPMNANTAVGAADVVANATASGSAKAPAIAGGPAADAGGAPLLVVWTNDVSGKILGRIYHHTSGALTPAADIAISKSAGDSPKVAGSAQGWVVAWHGVGANDADDIQWARVDANGNVTGESTANQGVGAQTQPAVAMAQDGSFAIVWRDDAGIRIQRFGAGGAPVSDDQSNPVSTGGAPSAPSIAAGTNGPASFYAIAWQDDATGDVMGRFAGVTGGWFFHTGTGQSTPFTASSPGLVGARAGASVAVGGAGWVAFTWQDGSDAQHGIFTRRLPLPTAN